MALLKVFVSSTCYDLSIVRGELRTFISNLGHDPVMSDYNDILFDPSSHTHESCLKEVTNVDVVILIIGSRYGGKAIPKAISSLDIELLKDISNGTKLIDDIKNVSITQLEILKAIEHNVPVFTFVDSKVMHDHLFYEKNKDKDVIYSIEFPSIAKKDTAIYIFEFINFLRLRTKNNAVIEYSKLSDIEVYLKKQWSSLLQQLLYQQRFQKNELKRIESFSEELKDIKSLILTSISSAQVKEIGRGVLRYRRVVEFLLLFQHSDITNLLTRDIGWKGILKELDIVDVVLISSDERGSRSEVYFVKSDSTYYNVRYPLKTIDNMETEWSVFKQLSPEVKTEIITSIAENSTGQFAPPVRYYQKNIDLLINKNKESYASPDPQIIYLEDDEIAEDS